MDLKSVTWKTKRDIHKQTVFLRPFLSSTTAQGMELQIVCVKGLQWAIARQP